MTMLTCPHCGNPRTAADQFCPSCRQGWQVRAHPVGPPAPKGRPLAILALVVVLGIVGAGVVVAVKALAPSPADKVRSVIEDYNEALREGDCHRMYGYSTDRVRAASDPDTCVSYLQQLSSVQVHLHVTRIKIVGRAASARVVLDYRQNGSVIRGSDTVWRLVEVGKHWRVDGVHTNVAVGGR
ncbi:MAG: hypothetical protein ACJ72D_22475 [Marmoricola sp.]